MLSKITTYFSSQIQEIENLSALRIYGVFLSLNYLLTAIYWYLFGFSKIFAKETNAICWPQFYHCQNFRFLDEVSISISFFLLGALGIVGASLFLFKKIRSAYVLLVVLEVLKLSFMTLDFQARMNQHYMSFFAFFFFVFIPQKHDFSRYIIVAFYFFAGLLKFKPEWISGDAIYGRLLFIPDSLKSPAAIYVICLELVLVWGLLSKNKTIFWITYFQFLVFHLTSFTVVGFFYPLLMYSLLTIFPLLLYEKQISKTSLKNKLAGVIVLVIFSILNIWPKLIPGDNSITGEGRLVALHMFDSKVYCDSTAIIKFIDAPPVIKDLRLPAVMRIRCDPIIFLSQLRRLCQELKPNPQFKDIEWILKSSSKLNEPKSTVVHISEFCKEDPTYSIWGNNPWIQK